MINKREPKTFILGSFRVQSTWTLFYVAAFCTRSWAVAFITPEFSCGFLCSDIGPTSTSAGLRALPDYPIIPLTMN